jgi:signal transduction histidine kinase
MSLCEPRGFLASYILDGGRKAVPESTARGSGPASTVESKWLNGIQERNQSFYDSLAEARATASTPQEKEVLDRLEETYRKYEATRNHVVVLYDRGDVEEAKRVLFSDVNELYEKAFAEVGDFVESTQRNADTQAARVEEQVAGVTGLVAIGVVVAVALGTLLVWLFFYGVLRPLRRMMVDARQFSGKEAVDVSQPQDELRAVGDYLSALMSDMADTRSDLKRSRQQLFQSEKLASVGKLAAGMAHEIRNPLTSMKMWLFTMRKSAGDDPELSQGFDIVSEEMARLENIVHNFLEFSRPPALKPRPQSVCEVIDKTLDLARLQIEEKNITLENQASTGLPPVMADRDQLKQVFINLLNNAVEATPQGGRIRLCTTLAGDQVNGRTVVVRVQNSGPGIPEEVRQRIFEPFFTTKEHGTGLGLCIAARIMAAHGGRLVLESAAEWGTSFAVSVPTVGKEKP